MESVRNYIYRQVAEQKLTQLEAKQMLLEMQGSKESLNDDIAIIGISGRFGGADNLNEYWENLKNGVCSLGDFPKERRKDIDPLLKSPQLSMFLMGSVLPKDANPEELDLYYKGGYLKEIDKFDAGFFNIPPKEAKFISPVQRLLLETSWEAIEDGGYGGEKILNTNTGVFVGYDNTAISLYKYITVPDPLHETGSYSSILASRISYLFNLKGPAVVMDTACSSSLVALHMAAQAIKNKDCEMAIVGGIYVLYKNLKNQNDLKSNLNKATSDEECIRTFDKKAKGTVWSEGVGTILIKPLKKAISDRDNIYAVIKGTAINNDGFSNGITAPNAEAQEEVIVRAWKEAKINPENISYIESHGTGTVLGDPIEIKGLTNAFRRFTEKKQFCGIGSVKPNIGHSISASGMASIFKVIMAMKHNEIPPSINFDEANPFIDFAASPLYVNDKSTSWNKGSSPRLAGISAFGFSGTNCHLVLEEPPVIAEETTGNGPDYNVLALSGRDERAIIETLKRYYDFLQNEKQADISDICFTANTGRGHYSNRLTIIASDCKQLSEKIGYLLEKGLYEHGQDGVAFAQHKVIVADKKNRENNEITEKERKQLTDLVRKKIDQWISSEFKDASCLNEICDLYTKGARVDWDTMYKGQKRRRVALPVYPFERTRYWADLLVNSTGYEEHEEYSEEVISPLLDKQLCDSLYQGIFKTEFNINKQWILTEHKVLGNSVVPGTAQLEMTREACRKYYGEDAIEIKNVVFFTPLVINESENKEVQLILKKESDHMEFAITSKSDGDSKDNGSDWVVHTEGKVYRIGSGPAPSFDVNELKKKLTINIDMEEQSKMKNFTFGPRWNNIAQVHVGQGNEALLTMQLPEAYVGDVDSHSLHPALLDNAVNGMAQHVKDKGMGGMYLPLSYKSIKIFGKLPGRFFSYARRIMKDTESNETKAYDITLIDFSGNVVAEISEYTIKRVNKADKFLKVGYGYEIGWTKEEQGEVALKDDGNGCVLVFKDKSGYADSIIQELKASEKRVVAIEIGKEFSRTDDGFMISSSENDYNSLLKEIKEQKPVRIIHLSSIVENSSLGDMEKLAESVENGALSLFYLTKALVNNKYNDSLEISLLSNYACKVTGDEECINPHGAALFGVAKVASQEYTHLKCRCIDIDNVTSKEKVIKEIYSDNQTVRVAMRDGNRYVEEFREIDANSIQSTETEIRDNGVYIITGGLGGIGLEVAKYLASKNKVNLALLNRSKFLERNMWDEYIINEPNSSVAAKVKTIKSIEENGSHVECISCDISNYSEMEKVLRDIKTKFGNLNGVVHSAGVAGEGFIFTKDDKEFKKVLSPKIFGTWVIDRLTQNEDMDFFVMFSSIASVLGGAGQSNYTAANSFMDAYAAYRGKNGKKTISIDWPAWIEVGMAAEHDFGQDGNGVFKPISADNAMFVFDRIINTSLTNIIPAELNYDVASLMMDKFPIRLSEKIRAALQKRQAATAKSASKNTSVSLDFKVTVKGLDNEGSEVKEKIAQIWGRILEVQEIDIYENFYSLGGDSMLAAQLIKELDKEYPGVVNIADIFSYPSIAQLADYIESSTGKKVEAKESIEQVEDESDKELKEMLDKLESGESSVEDAWDVLKKIQD